MTVTAAPGSPGRTSTRVPAPTPAFREGVRAMAPVLAGLAPFGFVVGTTAAASSVPSLAGWATSWLIYAGSAQLAAIQLVDAGAAGLVVVGAIVALNARFIVYGAGLAVHWRDEPRWWRALAAYLLVDPTYALATARFAHASTARDRRHYYLGAALTLWVGWQIVTAAGVLVGAGVPDGLSLEFAAPLCLIGLLVPQASSRSSRTAGFVGAGVAIGAAALPLHLGAVVGTIAGVAAACVVARGAR